MARTDTTVSRERVTVIRRYPWPEKLLNWWTIVMLATGGLITGVFGDFMSVQNRMGLGIPWLFPYGVTVGSLTLFFIIIMIILLAQNKMQPAWVLLGAFILIALFLAGLIETAIQLFGNGNVSTYCNRYVSNNDIRGINIDTLAWLEQNSICNQWDAVFAFWIIGLVFLVWIMVMASQMIDLNSKTSATRRKWAYWIRREDVSCNCSYDHVVDGGNGGGRGGRGYGCDYCRRTGRETRQDGRGERTSGERRESGGGGGRGERASYERGEGKKKGDRKGDEKNKPGYEKWWWRG